MRAALFESHMTKPTEVAETTDITQLRRANIIIFVARQTSHSEAGFELENQINTHYRCQTYSGVIIINTFI